MDKIIINGKEIKIGPDGTLPLSEEELEGASGGLVLPRGMMLYQWKCREQGCSCASEWYDEISECRENLKAHILGEGHYLYDYYVKRLD